MGYRYKTEHEIAWIRELARRDPQGAASYCRMILRVPRRWDRGVEVERLHEFCRQYLKRAGKEEL